jgi:methylglutaconyl-CoA hydratase
MSYETISLTTDERGVATLKLDRAEKRNAMSGQMLAELAEAADRLAADAGVRVVVLTGAGDTFCAGGDLAWMKEQRGVDPETRGREARKLAVMLQKLNTLPQPVIGRVQGNAFGGGVGMASVCDIAIGVESVKMGFTEPRLGLIPATIGPYVLARMGEGKARRVFMNAKIFDATEAVDLGLLTRAVPDGDLDAAVEAEVAAFLACAPQAVAAAKRLTRFMGVTIDEAVIDHTIAELVACWEREEAEEGISAFFEKRTPAWRA